MEGKPKHSLSDLNEYLFDELNALTNSDLKGETLTEEIERSKAIVQVAGRIAGNAAIQIQAAKLALDKGGVSAQMTDEAISGLLSSEG